MDNPPLHAIATGASGGPNGVFAYGATSTFPNQTWFAANYWVDVMFRTTALPESPARPPSTRVSQARARGAVAGAHLDPLDPARGPCQGPAGTRAVESNS